MNRNIQNNRFVVFLDIMGFKDRVARNSPEQLYEELSGFNSDIVRIISHSSRKKFVNEIDTASSIFLSNENKLMLAQFSDSIAIFTQDDSQKSLSLLAESVSKIFMSALTRKNPIPLKGALSKGYITCDMTKQLFFGQAIIDAYLLEENVQYYGIVVHHTAENDVKQLNSNLFRDTFVPLKSGRIKHFELSWYTIDIQQAQNGLEQIRLTVSDSPRKYIDNTISVIEESC